jgi:hypothetical protein
MISTVKEKTGLALIAALMFGGLLLFLVSVPSGHAATSTQTQNLQAELNSQVSWGSAGGCVQNMATNDFGSLTPNPTSSTLGTFDALPHASSSTNLGGSHVWVGCVTSNAGLTSVTAQGTSDMASGADTLALSNVAIGVTNTAVGGGCNVAADAVSAGTCNLPADGSTSRTLLAGAPRGTNELNWQYQLNLPANQPTGNYIGGQVTFTATS